MRHLGIFTYDESTALSKAGTGILGRGEDQTRLSDCFDRDFPPGVPRGGEVKFWYPANNPAYRGKPTKLIIAGESYLSPHFAPIRFKLNCTHK